MAAKLLEHLKDERKQTGCMTCFIHLFDPRIHTLFKVIPSCGCEEVEQTIYPHGLEMRSNRNSNDILGMYTESSRASSSSSPSSSFSSLDYSKVMHTEPSSYDRIIFPESPLLDRSLSHSSSSWRMRQRSFDLNEAVKDLSCTADGVEESALLKCQDSPRPLQPMKLSVGSLYALSEHKGSPLKFKDSLCLHNADEKSSAQLYKSKGTQQRYQTKETQTNCGTMDELARLSTDSRECSLPNSESRTMHHNQRRPSIVEKLMGLEAMPGVSNSTMQNSNKFAKNGEGHDTNMMYKSASPANPFMPVQVSSAQRFARKDHAVHKWKNGEMGMKPLSSSRILIEPAPWKQPDVNRTLLNSAVKPKQGSARSSNGFAVAYSKFEGRLKDIELHRFSKDLKALKQMLDAVQKNGSWRAEKNVLITGMTIKNNPDLDMTPKTAQQRETHKSACISEADGEQESRVKSMKSPIVLMKPITLLAKSDIAASSVIRSEGSRHLSKPHGNDSTSRRKASSNTEMVKGQNARNRYQSPRNSPGEKKLAHMRPTTPQSLSKEKKTNSPISASRRMHQQKKFEFEKKPRPATKSREATKLSMPISKHPIKSCTSGGKSRSKYAFIQQCNAQSSGFSTESKDASYCEDDTEVTSKLRLDDIDGGHSPARKVIRPMFSGIRKHKPGRIPCEDSPLAHPATTAPEQPSPISILDSTVYRDDDPPFPLKKTSSCDTKTGISSSNHLLENAARFVTSISREKLKQIEDLVLKLKGVSSTYDESSTDFIASHCKTTNPDQRYISKILLASGFLLRDFESTGYTFQPHISGHPINPELFFVLEQTKSGALLPTGDSSMISASKSHRRLIFDSCNEILAKLLVPPGMSDESQKLARKNITARRLLKDLCDRVEQLQDKSNQQGKVKQEEAHDEDDGLNNILFEDMKLKSDKWENSENCIPEVVLDIERMLYKDLVKEIISDEGVLSFALRSKAGRSCDRKLCFNNI